MVEIYDLLGEPIKVGSLIAFSGNNLNNLRIAIVAEIHKDRINFFSKHRKKLYQKLPAAQQSFSYAPGKGKRRNKKFLGYGEWKLRKSWIAIEPGKDYQDRIVVIKNPLFLLKNQTIAAQLEIMDLAKDLKLFPQGYVLGQPLDENLDLSSLQEAVDMESEDVEDDLS